MFMILAYALFVLGGILLAVGGIWQLMMAFKQSPIWGVASLLLCGIGGAVWCLAHLKEGWRPLVTALGGVLPLILGSLILVMETATQAVK